MVDLIWRCSTLSRFKFCFRVTSCYRMAAVRKTVEFLELFHAETVAVKSRSDARKGGGGAHFREKIVEVRWQVEFEDDKFVAIFVNQCGQPTDKCIQWQSLRDIVIMLTYAPICSNMLKSFMSAMGHQEPSSLSRKQCDTLLAPVAPEGYSFRSLTSPKKRIASRSQMLPHGNDTMIKNIYIYIIICVSSRVHGANK